MARDVFGNKRLTKEDMYTKKMVTSADVRMEYYKGILWFVAGYLYFHYVIMGWTL
jgi:hypothetical protein